MEKQHILNEIRRAAARSGGAAPGRAWFEAETGIKESDWRGRFWARWSDAIREAGLTPNALNQRSDEAKLFGQLAAFIRELGRYPTVAEMRLRKRQVQLFPNHRVLERMGSRQDVVRRLSAFCEGSGEWQDVVTLCKVMMIDAPQPEPQDGGLATGYVYLALMKIGRERRYKIGKANLVEQRARQVAVKLPEDLELIHAISTDDAYGIEAYWHRRFAEKRRGGEWFILTTEDVRAFKRRRFQ